MQPNEPGTKQGHFDRILSVAGAAEYLTRKKFSKCTLVLQKFQLIFNAC
jgi:hypothetical protein